MVEEWEREIKKIKNKKRKEVILVIKKKFNERFFLEQRLSLKVYFLS
jgi:hypothetical protein